LLADDEPAEQDRIVEPLTNRERSVLTLLPSMMNNAEIAAELFLSVNTVKVHLKSLYRKLGVNNRRQAVRAGRRLELWDCLPDDRSIGSSPPRGLIVPARR
jgi:LuxR family maltose regulon positive regulatory protein